MLDNTPDILTFNECREVLKIGKNSLLDLLHNNYIEGFELETAGRFLEMHCSNILNIGIKKYNSHMKSPYGCYIRDRLKQS